MISLAMVAAGLAGLVIFRLIHRPPPAVHTFDVGASSTPSSEA
jgi:hypothetical protein